MGVRRKKWLPIVAGVVIIMLTLASRILVARYLANDEPDDGRMYELLARNLLEQHVFSVDKTAPFNPTLIRTPGYPLFLAGVYAVFGHGNNTAVRMVQAVVDTGSCVVAAMLAWNWVEDEGRKRRAWFAALILSALCPFIAIYVATILSETLTTFLMLAMTLSATYALKSSPRKVALVWWVTAGLLAGACVMVRPDSGLFAAGLGLTLLIIGLTKRSASQDEKKGRFISRLAPTLVQGAIFSLAFALVLAPWAIRNERIFHLFQPLAPAHAEMPGEFVPHGYLRWLRTWIDDQRYIEPMLWDMDDKPIRIEQLPAYAFDSEDEKARVAALLDRYNHPPQEENSNESDEAGSSKQSGDEDSADDDSSDSEDNSGDEDDNNGDESDNSDEEDNQGVEMTPEVDAGFAQLAEERIARAPLRYYLWLPVKRGVALWFDTHSAYYPFEGELFPLTQLDRDEHQQIWLPLFAALMWLYTLLGLVGALLLWLKRQGSNRRWLLLAALMVLPRIIFFSTIENPEPRYVIELFAFVSILGGLAIALIRFKRRPD